MDLVTAEITVGGDIRNTVFKGSLRPITVPEADVLRALHGEANVKIIAVVGSVKRDSREEKARLSLRYNPKIVESLFPGVKGQGMDMTAPKGTKKAPKPKVTKKVAVKKAPVKAEPEED